MKDFSEAIAVKSVDRCADVSVIVLFAVPFDQDCPLMVRMVVELFLITSVLV